MNGSNLKEAFVECFTPKSMLPFSIGAIAVGVLGNSAYQLLTNTFGTQSSSVIAVVVVTVLSFLLVMAARVWQATRPGAVLPLPHPLRQKPRPRKGLLFLFGRREVCREALKAHANLERLWLVCTPQNNSDANEFAAEIQAERSVAVETRVVDDANDPLAFYSAVQKLLRERPAGWSVEDLIADYVGLTAHASIGMVLACLHEKVSVQYTPGEYDASLKAIRPLPSFEVILQGQSVASAQK